MRSTTRTGAASAPARRLTAVAAVVALLVGCSSSPEPSATPTEPSPTAHESTVGASSAPSTNPESASIITLRDFPAFPDRPFGEPVAASLQVVLDDAVGAGTLDGITAAVIVGDAGHWSGAAGVDPEQERLTPDSPVLTASIGKTVTAAQVLRLVEDGAIGLDDPAADHLPPELDGYDANGATVREVLGMRSGIADPQTYIESVDAGVTIPELVETLPEPLFEAGSGFSYGNMNYVLLGSIIEHETGRSLREVLSSDVLHHPGLGGLRYPVRGALAADGWRIESDPASLARWGYELYGGSVLAAASLRAMTDFGDEVYGLGVLNMSGWNPATDDDGFGEPAIGHAGLETGIATMLVAFPRTGEVVSVQTYGGELGQIKTVIQDLLAVVRAAPA